MQIFKKTDALILVGLYATLVCVVIIGFYFLGKGEPLNNQQPELMCEVLVQKGEGIFPDAVHSELSPCSEMVGKGYKLIAVPKRNGK